MTNEILHSAVTVFLLLSLMAVFQQVCLYHVFNSALWKHFFEKHDGWWDPKPWISAGIGITWVMQFGVDFADYIFGGGGYWLTQVLSGLFIAGGATGVLKFAKGARRLFDEYKEFRQHVAITKAANP